MDWDKLRIFHAVADAGSLTHAGEQLGLSQSAISRQIRALEEQLQCTLFHRHARGLLLTEQGELLYEATLAMSKRLSAAAARIRDSKDEVHGDLRVTATSGFGTLWLVPRLHRLFEAHPKLSVNLILTESILDLPMREADIAIRMASPQQPGLIRRPVMEVAMRLYASKDYIQETGMPGSVDELAERRVISFSPNAPQPHAAAEWLARHIHPQRHTHLMINSYFGVLKAAINGLGISALPDYITRDYPELVNILPEEASPPFPVYIVYPEELRRSQRVLAFRDFMVREIEAFNRREDLAPSVAAGA